MRRAALAAILSGALAVGAVLASVAAAAPSRHGIEARLEPQTGSLEIVDVIALSASTAVNFRLASWLAIDRVLVDGQPVRATAAAGGWRVALPEGNDHELELHLRGMVPPLRPDQRPGASARAGSGAAGSYLPGHAAWIPDFGDDRMAYRLGVEVPAPYRAVATGDLEEETLGAATNRAVFAARYPVEPPSLFAGPYMVRERRQGSLAVRTYFHSELAELSDVYLADSLRYLAHYRERIGPYPFQGFHVISSPLPVGLGFPGLTYIGRRVLPLPFMRTRSLAHEVVHNWWGNGVAVDYASGNWAEGLTTYMADHDLAGATNPAKAREMRLGWLRNYAALPKSRDFAAAEFKTKRHDAAQVIGYDKVAFVFHMLKGEIGEAAFAEALRLFWRHNRFRVAGWGALREAFEEVSGRDLAWFFAQWLERPGAPRLRLGDVEPRTEAGAYEVRLTLSQEKPAYRLTVPLTIETGRGLVRKEVVVRGPAATFSLRLQAPPLAVHVDPQHDLFRRLLPGEAPPILRDVTLAPDAVTFIAARDDGTRRIALRLAERLLDAPPRLGSGEPSTLGTAPRLVIGTTPEVEAFLARVGMAGVPDLVTGRGTARVWTARRGGGAPSLVVAADDGDALKALVRPLPHYGGKSYLVFNGGRAIDHGVWTIDSSPLSRRFDQ